MAKRGLIIPVSLILGLLLFGYILGDIPIGETLSLLNNAKLHYVLLYMLVYTGRQMAFSLIWFVVLHSQKERVSYIHLLNYRMVDYAISFLTPGPKVGGEFTRAKLLERHGIKYSKALSSSVIDKTMEIFGNALFLMLGVVVVTFIVDLPLVWSIILYAISIIFLGSITFLFVSLGREKSIVHSLFRILRLHNFEWLKKKEKGIINFEKHLQKFYKADTKYFFLAILAYSPSFFLSFLEYHFLLKMIGLEATLPQLFLMFQLTGAIYTIIPIPMGIGAQEAGQISLFALLNKDSKAGVLVALINRVMGLVLSAWGLAVLGYYGLNVKEVFKKTFDKGLSMVNGKD